jgi:hypothetical protein
MGTFSDKLRSFVGGKAGGSTKDESRLVHRKLRENNNRLKQLRKQVEEKDWELARLRARLAERGPGTEPANIKPENIAWIFGAGRTGSTWLSRMMEEMPGCAVWREPLVGELFGNLYYNRGSDALRKSSHFVLGTPKETWLPFVRSFVLEGAAARFPDASFVVVKEPNGSIGAPLLSEALPESRLLLLVRDPRDAVASVLVSGREGNWRQRAREKGNAAPEQNLSAEKWAGVLLKQMTNAVHAYRSHRGPKTLLRYEDLRANPLTELRRVYAELGIPADEVELERAVETHAWENIPEEDKGEGKFYRKAKPGSWTEDLTPHQARTVEEITRPILEEFYSDA